MTDFQERAVSPGGPEGDREGVGPTEQIAEAIRALYRTYTPGGVGVWLVSPKSSLGGRSPLDLLHDGDRLHFALAVARLGDWEPDYLSAPHVQAGTPTTDRYQSQSESGT